MKSYSKPLGKYSGFDSFQESFVAELDRFVDAFLDDRIRQANEQFMVDGYALIKEYCGRPGKRIRPLLVMLSYMGYGGRKKYTGDVLSVAASVELMHSFLLIQDDIIDRAASRRGGPALHVAAQHDFSGISASGTSASDAAFILADVVMACALELAGSTAFGPKVMNNFWKVFSSTYELTAWGQVRDIMYSMPTTLDIDEDVPEQISRLKTAHYTIRSPLHMGYVLTGKQSGVEVKRIDSFGMNLGMAFQVRDDIIGVFGKQDETGKPVDSDLREGKYTLLVRYAYQLLDEKRKQRLAELFCAEEKTESGLQELRSLIRVSGSLERARDDLVRYTGLAEKELQSLSASSRCLEFLQEIIERISRY
ncbi:MAG: polyprenyl synthetase family protein [Spirochaetota bacterium]